MVLVLKIFQFRSRTENHAVEFKHTNPLMATLKPQGNGALYCDWYTGR